MSLGRYWSGINYRVCNLIISRVSKLYCGHSDFMFAMFNVGTFDVIDVGMFDFILVLVATHIVVWTSQSHYKAI